MSYGRRVIYSDATEITRKNVVEEVTKAAMIHAGNRNDIQRLYDIYTGKTSILNKTKETREAINHKICENRAYEVTSFYQGYIFGEPIQYVRREDSESQKDDDAIAGAVNRLNSHMVNSGKAAVDKDLGKWILIGGNGYRLCLPNKRWTLDGDESPFKQQSLDPRQTFVVYHSGIEKYPLMSVYVVERENHERIFSGYTDKYYFEISEFDGLKAWKPHALGMNPIIEYTAESRLGAFEVVVDLLDSLNELQSNRMDDIVQFVNSFLAILGGQLDEETYAKLEEWKTLCLPEGVDAKYLVASLNQTDVQTMKDDLYQSILTITGVPNRNGGSSTSDNGVAVIYRDGFVTAESRSKIFETGFKEADRNFLRLALRILRDTEGTELKVDDIEAHFTRRNYENIANKAQVLTTMLNNPKIHPELAFQACGMFPDPEAAYLQSMAYYEEQMEKWEVETVNEGDDDVRVS